MLFYTLKKTIRPDTLEPKEPSESKLRSSQQPNSRGPREFSTPLLPFSTWLTLAQPRWPPYYPQTPHQMCFQPSPPSPFMSSGFPASFLPVLSSRISSSDHPSLTLLIKPPAFPILHLLLYFLDIIYLISSTAISSLPTTIQTPWRRGLGIFCGPLYLQGLQQHLVHGRYSIHID